MIVHVTSFAAYHLDKTFEPDIGQVDLGLVRAGFIAADGVWRRGMLENRLQIGKCKLTDIEIIVEVIILIIIHIILFHPYTDMCKALYTQHFRWLLFQRDLQNNTVLFTTLISFERPFRGLSGHFCHVSLTILFRLKTPGSRVTCTTKTKLTNWG